MNILIDSFSESTLRFMNEYTVKVTKRAARAMDQIADYITYNLMNPEAAIVLANEFCHEIRNLRTMPSRFESGDEEKWGKKGFRRLIVKNYFIYFVIKEEDKTVYVIDVIYMRRNQSALPESAITE